MKILNKFTIRYLQMNKKRTAVTIFGIILSTILMMEIGLLFSTIRQYLLQINIDNYGSHHVYIEIPQEKKNILEENKNIKNYFYLSRVGFSKLENSANPDKPYLYIASVSKENSFQNLKLKEGRYPENEKEIVIPTSLQTSAKWNFQIGDTVFLEVGKRMWKDIDISVNTIPYMEGETLDHVSLQQYTIVGVVETCYLENRESPGFMAFTIHGPLSSSLDAYITYKNVRDTYSLTNLLLSSFGEKENPFGYKQVEFNKAVLSLSGIGTHANVNNGITGIVLAILSLLSVTCAMVIYNAFAISVTERKKQFALLASIGATPKQRKKCVVEEAFLVSILGIPIGIFLSIFLGFALVWIINSIFSSFFLKPITLSFYPLFVLFSILFIGITIMFSVYLPSVRASMVSPIEAILQNSDVKIPKEKFSFLPLIQNLFGIEASIAYKNQKRNKKRYRVTMISLITSIVLFLSFSGFMKYFLRYSADLNLPNYDLFLTVHKDASSWKRYNALFNEIQSQNEVVDSLVVDSITLTTEIDFKNYTDAFQEKEKESRSFDLVISTLSKEDYEKYKKQIGLQEDRPILVNDYVEQEIKDGVDKKNIYHPFQENAKITISPHATTYQSNGTYQEENLNITYSNIYLTDMYPTLMKSGTIINEGYYVLTLFVPEQDFIKLWERLVEMHAISAFAVMSKDSTLYTDSVLYVKSPTYQNVDSFITNSIAGMKNVYYHNISKEVELQKKMVLALQIIIYIVIFLIGMIAIASIFNTIYASITLRRKEFAMLRSMGLTPKGLSKMLAFESLLIGLKALFFAIPISLFFLYLFSRIFYTFCRTRQVLIPITSIFVAIFVVFLLIFFTMYYASRKMKKENILDALREENI